MENRELWKLLFWAEIEQTRLVPELKKMEVNQEETSIHKTCATFASMTSVHGICFLFSSRSSLPRITWTILLLGALFGFGLHLTNLVSKYLAYDYHDVIKNSKDSQLIFPHVTICDSEAISEYALLRVDIKLVRTTFQEWINLTNYIYSKGNHGEKFKYYKSVLRDMRTVLASASKGMLERYGVPAEDIIVNCKYFGEQCSPSEFFLYGHPFYWRCFTFKSSNGESRHHNIGPRFGLSLILVSQDRSLVPYYNTLSNTANNKGLRISIHEPDTDPAISDTGIDILPGTSTSMALIQKEHTRLKAPYGHCRERGKYTVGSSTYNVTSDLCYKICLVENTLKKCNCISNNVDLLLVNLVNETVKNCLHLDTTNMSETVEKAICDRDVHKHETGGNLCACNWDCYGIDYDVSISQAKWPKRVTTADFARMYVYPSRSQFIQQQLKLINQFYASKMTSNTSGKASVRQAVATLVNVLSNLSKAETANLFDKEFAPSLDASFTKFKSPEEAVEYWVETSFYRLNVYFKERAVERHQQVVSFTMVDFWSAVGGIGGLWIGASLVSLIEMMSFLVSLCCTIYERLKENNENKVQAINLPPKT